MAGMQRAVPRAIETFEKSRARLDALANGEFAQSGLRFEIDGPRLREGVRAIRRPERLEALPRAEREAVLFLMVGDELGERGFARLYGGDGAVRAQLYRRGNLDRNVMEVTRGRRPDDRATAPTLRRVVDLGDGYELRLDVVRQFSNWETWMPVMLAFVSGVAAFLLFLPLLLGWILARPRAGPIEPPAGKTL